MNHRGWRTIPTAIHTPFDGPVFLDTDV